VCGAATGTQKATKEQKLSSETNKPQAVDSSTCHRRIYASRAQSRAGVAHTGQLESYLTAATEGGEGGGLGGETEALI